jgi:hypothetical protein
MPRVITVAVALALITPVVPIRAQGIPVFDVSNLAQLIEMATRTLATLNTMKSEYELITRMAQGMGSLNGYIIPDIATATHDVARFPYGAPWLEGLNSGDARGDRYFATVHQLQRPDGLLERLPIDAQRAIKSGYATIEILDSVAMMGGHQSAIVRTYQRQIADVIRLLQSDVLSKIPGFHALTAIADKISAGQLISRRSDMAANQLTSHVLEQLIAKNKRTRDAEAASMNMRLNALKDHGDMSQSLVKNAESALRNWRQP